MAHQFVLVIIHATDNTFVTRIGFFLSTPTNSNRASAEHLDHWLKEHGVTIRSVPTSALGARYLILAYQTETLPSFGSGSPDAVRLTVSAALVLIRLQRLRD